MKKYFYYFLVIVVVIVFINVYFNIKIYKHQLAFQRNIMYGQVETATTEIERELLQFEYDVNSLLFFNSFDKINLQSDNTDQPGLKILELIFAKYTNLVKNISIYDQNGNILNLSFSSKDKFLIDPYQTQNQALLLDKESIVQSGDFFEYTIPVFQEQSVYYNVVFKLDFHQYLLFTLSKYHHDDVFCHWIIDSSGNILINNFDSQATFNGLDMIKQDIALELSNFTLHEMITDHEKVKLLSVYYPLNALNQVFGMVFSMRSGIIFKLIINQIILIGLLSLLLLMAFYFFLFRKLKKHFESKEDIRSELFTYSLIFDHLPIGIMIIDQQNHTKIINQTAKDLLLIKPDEDIFDKNLSERFLLSKDYYDKSPSESVFDSDQFVVYRKEGEEVSVYKKELPFIINDEDLILSAFVDISHIEKSRKYEAAANNAKSEFLARMSHEIRTPMNGIIGMTEALNKDNLTSEQKEYLEIVKKSADLLLNLIDDILDFSKIEAGKMQIEEIPFKLRNEVKLCLDLFRPIIEDKNLNFSMNINPDVPDNIISDPFRLRQILSNLISNAIKFTHEGEISIGIEITEQYNHNLTLLFYVSDTGVGIKENQIETIFNSFTQAEASTSRKYGGSGLGTTIVKQLVTLMNGEIWVESPSQLSNNPVYPGTKFSFTIEAYSNEKLNKDLHFNEIYKTEDIRVLVILLNPQTKYRFKNRLQHENVYYDVFDFQNKTTDDLIYLLKNPTTLYHLLVIMDDTRLNGLQIANDLYGNDLTHNHLLLMISSNHKAENYIRSRQFNIDHYIVEPFESNDIIHCIFDRFPNVKRTTGEVSNEIRSDLSILVVDDNEINIKVAETIFSRLGISIDVARNGSESVIKVMQKHYDIVFMDLVMPDQNGVDTTIEIRGQGYQMPIIAMTATASSSTKSKAISSGMNDYIVKPVKMDTIRNILLKWFA